MKNVVLILTDTFRYDNLGEKALKPVRTPVLDAFAKFRAASIENFYTGSFPTIPHRTDVTTGRKGWPRYGWQPLVNSSQNHIPQMLDAKGYSTQLICDCPHLFNAGFNLGFDAAFQHRGQEGDIPLLHMNDPIKEELPMEKTRKYPQFKGHNLADRHRWANRYFQYETEAFPAKTAETAVRFLEENSKAGPFFLWVDFFDPHEPWDPPEYMVKRYDPEYTRTPMTHPNYGPSSAYTPEELRNLWAHYAAESELVDRWIGRIIQKIDDLQLWDDTVVVISADHGTSIGEHKRTGKSNIHDSDSRFWPIYPEVGHVPFLVASEGITPGSSLDLIAQPVDILPTVAELAGVELSPPEEIHGKSFAKALRQGKGRHRDYAVCAQHLGSEEGKVPSKSTTPFVVTPEYGYAPTGAEGKPELYALGSDPLAENNIASQKPDQVKELHSLLLKELNKTGAPEEMQKLWDD